MLPTTESFSVYQVFTTKPMSSELPSELLLPLFTLILPLPSLWIAK